MYGASATRSNRMLSPRRALALSPQRRKPVQRFCSALSTLPPYDNPSHAVAAPAPAGHDRNGYRRSACVGLHRIGVRLTWVALAGSGQPCDRAGLFTASEEVAARPPRGRRAVARGGSCACSGARNCRLCRPAGRQGGCRRLARHASHDVRTIDTERAGRAAGGRRQPDRLAQHNRIALLAASLPALGSASRPGIPQPAWSATRTEPAAASPKGAMRFRTRSTEPDDSVDFSHGVRRACPAIAARLSCASGRCGFRSRPTPDRSRQE